MKHSPSLVHMSLPLCASLIDRLGVPDDMHAQKMNNIWKKASRDFRRYQRQNTIVPKMDLFL